MTTWIFDSEKLDRAIALWVEKQKNTGHPKALRNADFVALAIRDFLETSETLYKKIPAEIPAKPGRFDVSPDESYEPAKETQPAKPVDDKTDNLSIESMLSEWYRE